LLSSFQDTSKVVQQSHKQRGQCQFSQQQDPAGVSWPHLPLIVYVLYNNPGNPHPPLPGPVPLPPSPLPGLLSLLPPLQDLLSLPPPPLLLQLLHLSPPPRIQAPEVAVAAAVAVAVVVMAPGEWRQWSTTLPRRTTIL